MELQKICKGVRLAYEGASQFKTTAVSLSLLAPLDEKTTVRALLPGLLARTTKQYPATLSMNRRLGALYGASITPSVRKQGEIQVLTLTLTTLDDRFALENESVCEQAIALLCDCLLQPDIAPDGFRAENVRREKELLRQKIDGENDDKRLYALRRMTEEMCANEPYRRSPNGCRDEIDAITEKDLLDCWKDLMLHANVLFSYVGSLPEKTVAAMLKTRFSALEKLDLPDLRTEFLTESYGSRTVRETQDVQQGKLVIGYRAGMTYEMDNYPAIRLMTAIFGGGTFSRLFCNVREKMSLCYYCSARLVRHKGLIIVESGIETENAEKALDAIRHELDEVRAGHFTDETLMQAKRALCDSLRSVTDSSYSALSWLESFGVSEVFQTPREVAGLLQNVSREEVILAANLITEDTVFLLQSGRKEAQV